MDFKLDDDACVVKFNEDELLILNNSFNEVCNGLYINDFEQRIGTSMSNAADMLKIINQSLNTLDIKIKEHEGC